MTHTSDLLVQAYQAWRDCCWEKAQQLYEQQLSVDPKCFEAHNGLGILYREWAHYELAQQHLQQALGIRPDSAALWGNWGRLYADLGQIDLALDAYHKAALLTQDRQMQAQLHLNRALALLAAGHWQAGWQAYAQWSITEPGIPVLQGIRWQGEPLGGETIWVDAHTHCGYGDILMFGRYLPLLSAQEAKVMLICPEAVAPLLQKIPGVKTVSPQPTSPIYDKWVPLYLLPFYLSPTQDSIPPPLSLTALVSPIRSAADCTIALNGACHPQSRSYIRRHCSLDILKLLSPVKNCRWICLQTDLLPTETQALQDWPHMQVLGNHLNGFTDTLSRLNQADLVITVDSVVAHLAGTLGKPVWVLLPYAAEWRWLQQRSDSPWYPTARLWRQAQPREWQGVLNDVKEALSQCYNDNVD